MEKDKKKMSSYVLYNTTLGQFVVSHFCCLFLSSPVNPYLKKGWWMKCFLPSKKKKKKKNGVFTLPFLFILFV